MRKNSCHEYLKCDRPINKVLEENIEQNQLFECEINLKYQSEQKK